MKDLAPRQRLFIREYIKDLNASQASIRAGYSSKNADVTGSQLLGNPSIRREVEKAMARREEKTEVDAEYLVMACKEIIERSLQREPVMVFDKAEKRMVQVQEEVQCQCSDPNCQGMLTEGVWKYDSAGAIGAIRILADHVTGFKAAVKAEMTGEKGGPIVITFDPGTD